ncbi:hypothetical protein [Vreelandella sulfidaeris]|uniref:hypothetical protein n=1 Tax=Vreelandella sulfidaeris TaxID=115553 RepID=UPI0035E84407
MSDKKGNKAKPPLHHRYIMGILAGVVVLLLAINWSQVSGLPEMLNMALALSSLILAGLAIVYSFHTSGSLNNTLDKIERSSSSIQSVSDEIKKSNYELAEKIDNIPDDLTEIKYKVDSSIETLVGIPSLINQLSRTLPEDSQISDEETNITGLLSRKMIHQGGSYTLIGLMMLKIAYEERWGIIIEGSNLNEKISVTRTTLFSSLELAMVLDLIDIDLHDSEEEHKLVEIVGINQEILDNIEKALIALFENNEEKAKNRKNKLKSALKKEYTMPLK